MPDDAPQKAENESVEDLLREYFDDNYELLRLNTGQALAPAARRNAFQQVLLYWKKLKDLARSVTETEVKLTLPVQESPGGHLFGIEGIVDIVKESGFTVMYDIKTHAADYVRTHQGYYEKQLNVYAHIWRELRGHELDRTTVIATRFPSSMKRALNSGDPDHLSYELTKWNPLIEIPHDEESVDETIEDFGRTVDDIKAGRFAPPPLEKLKGREEGTKRLFATRVCSSCDARFSCRSYRAYAAESRRKKQATFREQFLQTPTSEADQSEWLTANLEADPTTNASEEM